MTSNRPNTNCSWLFLSQVWRRNQYVVKAKLVMVMLFCGALSISKTGWAAGDDGIEKTYFSVLAGSPLISGSSPLEKDATASLTYAVEYEQTKKIQNIITLSLFEEIQEYIPNNFSANVEVRIEYRKTATSTLNSIDQVLTVDYNKAEGIKYNAKNYFSFAEAEYVKITVLRINTPMLGNFDTKKVLVLQNEMRVTRYYDLANNVQPSSFTSISPATGADELAVSWSWPASAGNTHTQLEWTWLEDELESSYYENGSLNYNLLFKNNATRIDLPLDKISYKIPLLYGGVGKLYFRIRAVNVKKSGNRSDGPWSGVQSQSFAGHTDLLNWQATTSFAEEGKRKTVVQYFDGSLRSRQTVTKENVTNTTVTAETFYDGQGRPAVQILPVPGINNVIGYTKNLNLFNGQAQNEDPSKFFDLQPVTTSNSLTPPLSASSGAAQYYSASNPEIATELNKNIPDAEGYPYTVTRYTPDGTGRIMAQSGVGAAMQMGKGHETKYYYGTAAQEELDGLFGTEVGNYTHYFKNMVKDANGQMSVSYVDMHGRTIATALAGDAPPNIVALNRDAANYPNQAGTNINRNLLDQNSNIVKNNSIESINTLLVPATTNYQFRYELNPELLQLASCTNTQLCYDCMYNLEISITDESGDAAPIVKKFNNINLAADDNCGTAIKSFENDDTQDVSNIVQFSQTLSPGSYIVRKTLTISEASVQKYKEEYLSKALCKTEQQLIDSVYNVMLSVADCDNPPGNTCTDCLETLGTYDDYKAGYLASAPNASEDEIRLNFNTAKLDCDRLCNTTSQTTATKRTLMLADMIPYSGQYAGETAPSAAHGVSMYNKYNIFSTANAGQPFYKKPLNKIKQSDYYRTNVLTIDPVIHPQNNWEKLEASTQSEFASLFTYSWAEALLPHHPEYDKLVFAEANLGESYNWINTFSNTATYNEAVAKGYIFTNSDNLNDIFYTKAPGSKANMVAKINTNYRNELSLWQIAYGEAKCKSILAPPMRNACYQNAPKIPPFNDLTTAEKDKVWATFRNLYAMERDNQVNAYITANVSLADAQTLVNEKYILHFPTSNNQAAEQYGPDWSWYPATPDEEPNADNIPGGSTPAQTYTSRCNSYITQWKQALEQCTALAAHPNKTQILNEITAAMVLVCQKGSNEANPFGSSNVAPNTPVDGSPRSFEEVINNVFAQYGIARDSWCNPFVIEFPKPYGKGPVFAKESIAVLDTCNCNRFTQLKNEAAAANYNPAVLSSLNQYLSTTYNDTLTKALYDAMQQNCFRLQTIGCVDVVVTREVNCSDPVPCGCTPVSGGGSSSVNTTSDSTVSINASSCQIQCVERVCDTTGAYYTLPVPQPMPEFLKCGFVAGAKCLDCAQISAYVAEFKTYFTQPYNAGPVFIGDDLTPTDVRDNILFQRFMNYRTGFQFSWMDYAKAANNASCNLANYAGNGNAHQNVICGDAQPLTETSGVVTTDPPCQKVYNMAVSLAQEIYKQRTEYLLGNFEAAYRAKCMAAKDIEKFTVSYRNSEYHYTLYYYDMAGSLVKTVPPKGVRPDYSATFMTALKGARSNKTALTPSHTFATDYRYNSLGQVVAQHTPDANTSKFWYDKLGRLAVSQNAQQTFDGKYSYTLYDDLGRITEVGQKQQTTVMTQTISQDPTALNNWILTTGGTREQITYTVYDRHYLYDPTNPNDPGLAPLMSQQNLRNRVSYTGTKNVDTDLEYYAASFYSYDIHGNVDSLVQYYKGIPEMRTTNNWLKLITYDYDLISGKVNAVNYQPSKADAFYHRYQYDAENRLINVYTSRDSIVWERDAAYNYYKHGPLARTELGQLRVQGLDYAYTLQGWLKGVNSTTITGGNFDIGKDGWTSGANSTVARDAVGFALHYYDAAEANNTWMDYKSIGGTAPFARPGATSNFVSLYNGNIGGISINNAGLSKGPKATTNALPLFYNYRYDQLNRIVSMQAYKGLDEATNQWNAISINDYAEAVSYDPNGNIITYNRKGTTTGAKPLEMDDLTYHYDGGTNRLNHVGDVVPGTNYTEDIDAQNTGNYTYDAIGNLKTDEAEGITNIHWTVYGKIASIVKGGNTITYSYDAAGNRITKTVGDKTTIYVRDASGNVMTVYEKPASQPLQQIETHLYGSSRLGMVTELTVAPQLVNLAAGYEAARLSVFTRGEKRLELSNHLGNVLAVITDKKTSINNVQQEWLDDFNSGTSTNWQRTMGATKTVEAGRLKVTASSTKSGIIRNFNTVAGRSYRLNFDVSMGSAAEVQIRLWQEPFSAAILYQELTTSGGSRTITFTAPSAAARLEILKMKDAGISQSFYIDNATLESFNAGEETIIDHYEPEIVSAQDYYPFGMMMSGRTYSAATYRYGFNGKEKSNEMYGEGNAYDFGARIYDPRINKWLSVDPLTAEAPGWSPYRAFYCNPIFWTDPTGMLEFKDYDTYKSHQTKNKGEVLSADKIGRQGHWLTSDRKNNTSVWNSANEFNLKNGTQNQYKAFDQIDDLYKWMDKKLTTAGHEIKWVKGAMTLTDKLRNGQSLKGMSEEGSFIGLLAELNEGIANLAVTEIGKALYGNKIYKGDDAYNFDLNLVTREQRDQAKPIYQKYQNKMAVAIMNDLVYSAAAPLMLDMPSFGWFRKRQSWFNIVSDWQIRVDVPLLMMYPEKHRMISDRQKIPNNVINSDGTLNARMLRFMKDYKIK